MTEYVSKCCETCDLWVEHLGVERCFETNEETSPSYYCDKWKPCEVVAKEEK